MQANIERLRVRQLNCPHFHPPERRFLDSIDNGAVSTAGVFAQISLQVHITVNQLRYGKGRIAYALSPDEYFSIDTRTSNESEIPVYAVESDGKLKPAVQPMKFDPDLSVGVACFKSREKRDLFLTAPDVIRWSVAATFGMDLIKSSLPFRKMINFKSFQISGRYYNSNR